jgi:putative transposase
MQLSQQYPTKALCEVLDYPRSQVYYEPRPLADEPALEAEIKAVAGFHLTYGYRRITEELKRRGHVVNHKRIARLMRKLGILGNPRVKRKRTTNSNHSFARHPNRVMNLAIERPDQVWVADISVPQQRRERWEYGLPQSAYRSRWRQSKQKILDLLGNKTKSPQNSL